MLEKREEIARGGVGNCLQGFAPRGGNGFRHVPDIGRLVGLATEWHGCQIRRVGFDEQAIRRHETGHLAQGRTSQGQSVGGNQRGQIMRGEMQTLAEGLSVFAFKQDQPVRDVILVQEIVELTTFARSVLAEDSKSCELLVPLQSSAQQSATQR